MDRIGSKQQTKLYTNNARRCLSIHRKLFWSRSFKSHNNTENHHYPKRHKHDKHVLKLISLCLTVGTATPSFASDIGGVSATANPVANSSGSVTNQAIQVLQGPYITNTYGDGISCQTATANFTPYITRTGTWQDPYQDIFMDPVYNNADNNDDNIPDAPGEILYYIPTRTGQKSTQNINLGFSATLSIPLDKEARDKCMEATAIHNEYRKQLTANKRLDFEIARLKNCGEMKKQGIVFHPKSPYYSVCADVMLINPPGVVGEHNHKIISKNTPGSGIKPNGNSKDLKTISIGN